MNKKPDEIEVRYYADNAGRKPFAKFFNRIKGMAAVKTTGAITRLRAGNTGDSRSVGKGVSELRIDWGPGYRIHYGWDGSKLIILLSGGAKKDKKMVLAVQFWGQNLHSKLNTGPRQRRIGKQCGKGYPIDRKPACALFTGNGCREPTGYIKPSILPTSSKRYDTFTPSGDHTRSIRRDPLRGDRYQLNGKTIKRDVLRPDRWVVE